MKSNGIIFFAAFLLAFVGGWLFFGQDDKPSTQTSPTTESETEKVTDEEKGKEQATASAEEEILSRNSCLGCHAVSSLGIEGGVTGPDLSGAYEGVEGKHGTDIESFLTEPTSAVMSSVIGGSPLSDEERTAIIDVLKIASEK